MRLDLKNNVPVFFTAVAVFMVTFSLFYFHNYIVRKYSGSYFDQDSVLHKNVTLRGIGKEPTLYQKLTEASERLTFGRDPFVERIEPVVIEIPKDETQYVLQGIMWEEGTPPQAIVNEAIVEVGTHIGSCIVIDIQKNKVILKNNSPDADEDKQIITLILLEYDEMSR